jgi:hypothetical protein
MLRATGSITSQFAENVIKRDGLVRGDLNLRVGDVSIVISGNMHRNCLDLYFYRRSRQENVLSNRKFNVGFQ